MASLPEVGGDVGVWGTELNDFLEVAHNSDGTLKSGLVGSTGPTGPVGPTGPEGGAGTQGLDGLDSTFLPVAPLAISGQTPSQNPVLPGSVGVGSLAVAARADHIHASAGLFHWTGDGSDGAATFDGTATPSGVTKKSSSLYWAVRNLNYSSMSISSGITLDMCGFKLKVNGILTGPTGSAATITCVSLGVAGGTNNSVAAGPNAELTNSGVRPMPLRGGSFGADGGTSAGSGAYYYSSGPYVMPLGGNGGAGSSGLGGTNAGTDNDTTYDWHDFITATEGWGTFFDQGNPTSGASIVMLIGGNGGSGGGGDGTNYGGGGGAGGNIVIVSCIIITGNINITTPGAPGGVPTTGNVGGGGGGAGGVSILNAADLSAWTGAVSAPGGAGGAGQGSGTAGDNGSAGIAQATQWL